MKLEYEYIVLGLGGLGSGTVYWLSRQAGRNVLGLEQFELGHIRGGSQDHSRIIRLSYHTPDYVKLAQQAYHAWATVEAEARERLVIKTGGLDFFPAAGAIPRDHYIHSLQSHNIPFELLEAAEVRYRWPQFKLPETVSTLYQAESGLVDAAKSNAIHQHLAREYGACLQDNLPITAVRPLAGEIEVVAGGQAYRCQKLLICAGAWTNSILAHFGLRLPLTVTQEQVTYFSTPHLADFSPERFPIWIWMDEPCYYGFPAYGEAATKVAQDVGGQEVTAETRTFEPNQAALKRVETFLQHYLPEALGPILYTKTCLYTMPPDRDFVIDALPGHPDCFIAIGAGHAFKFASFMGRTLSELAIDGTTPINLEPFKFDRPLLTMENPSKSFMV